MKSIISSMMISVALLAGFTSCNDDTWKEEINGGNETGQLSTASLTVDVSDAMERVNDKRGTTSRESIDLTNYIVTVTDKKTGLVVENWTYSEMPELPTFPVGSYTVTAKSHNLKPTAWDEPYYEGKADFDIKANQITECDLITCKFASVKVTVVFSQKLLKASNNGADLKVVVESTAGNSLEFTPETMQQAGFFEAADQTLSARFTGTVSGNSEDFTTVIENVSAGQHRRITYGLKDNDTPMPDETGNIIPGGISVSPNVEDQDLNVEVSWDEPNWGSDGRPKEEPDDPDVPDVPVDPTDCISFTSATLNLEAPNTTAELEGKDAVVDIKATHGITNLEVTIISDGLTPEVLSDVNLSDHFDLAHPDNATLKEGLQGLGFPVEDQVIGKTDISFDITQFVPLLNIYPGKNVFKIVVTDAQGHKSELELTINS